MMLEVVIGVLVMEVDKVADEMTDMEVDKVADMKIPIEDRTEVILEIGDWVKIPTWWLNLQSIQVTWQPNF